MNIIGRAMVALVTTILYITIDIPMAIFTRENI